MIVSPINLCRNDPELWHWWTAWVCNSHELLFCIWLTGIYASFSFSSKAGQEILRICLVSAKRHVKFHLSLLRLTFETYSFAKMSVSDKLLFRGLQTRYCKMFSLSVMWCGWNHGSEITDAGIISTVYGKRPLMVIQQGRHFVQSSWTNRNSFDHFSSVVHKRTSPQGVSDMST